MISRRPKVVVAAPQRQPATAPTPTSPHTKAIDVGGDANDAATRRESNLSNIVVGVILGLLVVFGMGFLTPGDTDNKGTSAATTTTVKDKSGGGFSGWFAPPADPAEEPPAAEKGAQLNNGTCKCSRHCITAGCRSITVQGAGAANSSKAPALGHKGERELTLLAQSVEFARCEAETCVAASTGACVAKTLSTEKERCSASQRYLINTVRKCLLTSLKPPKAFTLQRDSISGHSVLCRGDVPLESCRSEDGTVQANYFELKALAEMIGDKARNGSVTRFIDFGDNDGLLDVRMSALPNVLVDVLSMNPEQRNVAHISACVNNIPESVIRIQRYKFANDGAKLTKSIVPELPSGMKAEGTIMRINAPGYEESVVAELDATVKKLSPSVIITRANARALASWLVGHDYIMWNPKSCRLAQTEDEVTKTSSSSRATMIWVHQADKSMLRPRCRDACMTVGCVEDWRTEYRPCDTTLERCTADDLVPEEERKKQDGCYWTTTAGACKLDSNWQRVMKCADPRLPVAKFSIVDVRGVLVACEGAHDCVSVDTKVHDKTMSLLTSFVNQIKDNKRVTPEYVNVGAFVGNIGFSLSRQGVKAHLFEPVPSTRQWLKISKCVSNLGNVRVYDFGIGATDEDCAIAPDASVLAGNVNVTCPAHPVASRRQGSRQFDIIVPFRSLNTVYRQWVFDAELNQASVARPTPAPTKKQKTPGKPAAGNHNKNPEPSSAKSFILHFDEAVDAIPLLRSASQWLVDDMWRPATVIVSSSHENMSVLDQLLAGYGYTIAQTDGDIGFRVFIHSHDQ